MNTNEPDYFVFYNESGEIIGLDFIDEEDAKDRLTRDWTDEVSYDGMFIDRDHYFRGYYYYNDWSEIDDEDEYEERDFISEEHADLYLECNNAGGHFEMVKLEEIKS